MYNYYQPSLPQQQNRIYPNSTVPILKGYQVSGLEEVRAASIDFDGTIFYFPDLGNRKIYTKHINPADGTAQLNMYQLAPLPQPVDNLNTGDFITRQEFEQAITELSKTIQIPQSAPPSTNNNKYKGDF